jgi:putative heme iron utilization protein
MELTEEVFKSARTFVRSMDAGVLSSMIDHNGQRYPFGSMTTYTVTPEGEIAIYISDIALHTKNVRADNKVGFTVFKEAVNQQAAARIAIIGTGKFLEDGTEDYVRVAERYFSHFPPARSYSNTHNFAFFLIKPELVHYIRTFGQIYTFEGDKLATPAAEWVKECQGAIKHMNEDHVDALKLYCSVYLKTEPSKVTLVNMDSEGFHVLHDRVIGYIPFPEAVTDGASLRTVFKTMSEQCRSIQAAKPAAATTGTQEAVLN